MKKIAALGVFLTLVLSDGLGFELGLLPGLSVKNVMLYILVIWISLEAIVDSRSGGFFGRIHDYLPLHFAFIFLIVLAFVSSLVSIYAIRYPGFSPMYGVVSIKAHAIDHYLMIFVFLAAVRDLKEAIWMAKAMLISVSFVNLVSLIDMFDVLDLDIMTPRGDGRLQGPLGSSNEYGGLMAFYFPLFLVLLHSSRGRVRALWTIGTIICMLVMLFSTSRGAIVGLLGAGIIGWILLRRYVTVDHAAQAVFGVAIIGAAAAVFLAVEYGDLLYTRFVELNVSGSVYDQTSGRTKIWGDALLLMWESPITLLVGFGWKTFNILNPIASHNLYLEYFFDLGLIGLILLLSIFFLVIRYLFVTITIASPQTRVILSGFLFGFLSILISSFFSNLVNSWFFVWTLTGVMLRLASAERSSVAREKILNAQGDPASASKCNS